MRLIDADELSKWISGQSKSPSCPKNESAFGLRIIKHIDRMPSIQPEPQWIPCRETVDIPDHEILACDKYGEEMFGYLSYEDDQWLCVSDDCMMYDPIAWREKPEPYQEVGE